MASNFHINFYNFGDTLFLRLSGDFNEASAMKERIKELTGYHSLIEGEGNVVRSTSTGVAINFGKEYQILSLNCL